MSAPDVAGPRGATYEPGHDRARLARQFDAVRDYMLTARLADEAVADGGWRTLREIVEGTGHGYPEASVSARLRELRHNGYMVDRRRRGQPSAGLHEYRVTEERAE